MKNLNRTKSWVIGLLIISVISVAWWYRQQTYQNVVQAVYIGEGFNIAGLFKSVLSEYYLTHDKWPSSNHDMGLDAPKAYANNALKSAEITSKGEIKLTYDEKTGVDGGVVRLIPDDAVIGMIKWRCETADYPDISQYMPQCQYRPKLDTKVVIAAQTKHPTDDSMSTSTNEVDNEHVAQCDTSHKPMLLEGLFTRHIIHSSPVDHLQSLGIRQQELYFYSTVIGGSGQRISHRWLLNNQPVQEQTFDLGFDNAPIWSRQLLGEKQGDWEVQIWADNCLLDRFTIAYTGENEAQTMGIVQNHTWQLPKNVLDQIIIDSAKALVAKQDFTSEPWLFDSGMGWAKIDPRWKWMRERQASGIDDDDITLNIRAGNASILKNINYDRRNIAGDTPLIEAIKAGQEAVALSLLDHGANPFVRGVDGSRPYTLAINNKMDELRAAILNYAETETLWLQGDNERFHARDIHDFFREHKWWQRNALGYTPLLLAAREDNDWVVAVLLQNQRNNNDNINVFMNDSLGKRANDLAREQGNLFAADLIEKHQQQFRAPWQIIEASISTGLKGDRPLDCVEKQPLAKSVTYYYFNRLMDTSTDTLHHKWFYQNTLIANIKPNKGSRENILFSSQTLTGLDKGYWHVELVNEKGDILNRMDLSYGEKYSPGSALTTRCTGTLHSLDALIAGWQDPKLIAEMIDGMDDFDRSAPKLLSRAIQTGNISAVRILLDRSSQTSPLLNASDYSVPALLLAVKSSNPVMVKYLLYRGADVNKQNKYNFPALHQAVIDQNHPIIKLLLEAGATPTLLAQRYGSLPLISAANVCDIESMKLLVAHGARFDQKTKKGLTALDMAKRDCRSSEKWEQIKLLIERAGD